MGRKKKAEVSVNDWVNCTPIPLKEQLKYKEEELERARANINRVQHYLDHEKMKNAYLEGQLEVFKRESGRYPEIKPCREEYKNSNHKEIISTSEYVSYLDALPF